MSEDKPQDPKPAPPQILLPEVEKPGVPCVQVLIDTTMGTHAINVAGDPEDVVKSLDDFRGPAAEPRWWWQYTEPVYGTIGWLSAYAVARVVGVNRSYIAKVDPQQLMNRMQRRDAARIYRPGQDN